MSIYPSIFYFSIYLSIYLYFYLFIDWWTRSSICFSIFLANFLSFYSTIFQSIMERWITLLCSRQQCIKCILYIYLSIYISIFLLSLMFLSACPTYSNTWINKVSFWRFLCTVRGGEINAQTEEVNLHIKNCQSSR